MLTDVHTADSLQEYVLILVLNPTGSHLETVITTDL